MREALEIVEWGAPRDLLRILSNQAITPAQALQLFQCTLQPIFIDFEYDELTESHLKRMRDVLLVLTDCLTPELCSSALNTVTKYDMSLLERVCVLQDTIAQRLVLMLLPLGAHPLRVDAFSNAVHRCMENGNWETLSVFKSQGVRIEGLAAKKALECAALCSVEALRILIQDFGVDARLTLSDGGTVLHRIARDSNIEEAIEKIEYCLAFDIPNIKNGRGYTALDIGKLWGHCRVVNQLESYFERGHRHCFSEVHPFLHRAAQLRDMSTPDSKALADYLTQCATWGLRGKHRVFDKTGYGVGAIAIELGDFHLLEGAILEGETVNTRAPVGASLLGYVAVMYARNEPMRVEYRKMLDLLLEQPNIDWFMYDEHGVTVKTCVEHALTQKSHNIKDDVQLILTSLQTHTQLH